MRLKILFLFFLVGFATYSFSLNNAFVFDDEEGLQYNKAVHDIENVPSFFSTSTFNQGTSEKMSGIYYKPMLMTTYAVVWNFFGSEPMAFRIVQIAIHCLNAFMVFLIFSTFTSPVVAGLLGTVFLVHPINTETAIYISDYQEVLFTFFGLIALLILKAPKPKWYHHASLAIFLLASLLSKESGVLFLTAAALYIFIFRPPQRLRSMAAIIATVATYALLRFAVAGLYTVVHGVAPISRISFLERLLTFPAAMTHYFQLFVAPVHFTLARNWVVTYPGPTTFWLPLAFVLIALSTLYSLNRREKSKPLLFFTLCLCAGLFLHSQILAPLDATVADRWFYFPMFALLGILAIVVPWKKLETKKLLIVAAPLLIGLSARSFARSLNWENGYTLYKHDLEIAPDAYDIQNNFGVELFRRSQYEEALKHFTLSTQLAPHWTINWNNLGAVYEKFNQIDRAEQAYCRAVNNGVYYLAFENYAGLLIKKNQLNEALGFIEYVGLPSLPGNARLVSFRDYLKTLNVTAKQPVLPLSCPQT